jgi:hypothetical protein
MLPRENHGVVDAQLKVSVWNYFSRIFIASKFYTGLWNDQFAYRWSFYRSYTRCCAHSKFVYLCLFLKSANLIIIWQLSRTLLGKKVRLVYIPFVSAFTDPYSAADIIKSEHGLSTWCQWRRCELFSPSNLTHTSNHTEELGQWILL